MRHQKNYFLHQIAILFILSFISTSYGSEFSIRIYQSPETLDWQAYPHAHRYLMLNVMQGLFRVEPNLSLKKIHAESVDLNSEGTQYTITLKSDLKWSDGKPLTANDYIRSWKRLKDQNLPSNEPLLENIKNFKAINDHQIFIELKKRQPSFLYNLSLMPTFPLREDHLRRQFKLPIAVTGPYKITEWNKVGQFFELQKNKNFIEENQGPELVKIYILPDLNKAKEFFKQGRLSAFLGINTDIISEFNSANIRSYKMWFLDYLEFNSNGPLSKYPQLRKIIHLALNRNKLIQQLNSGQRVGSSLVLEGMLGHSETNIPHSLEKALELKQSWVKNHPLEKEKTFKILYYDTPTSRLMAKNISAQLELGIGLHVKSIFVPFSERLKSMKNSRYDAFLRFFSPATPLSDSLFYRYYSKNSENFSGFQNINYDLKYSMMLQSPLEKLNSIYSQLNDELVLEKNIVLPLADNGVTAVLLQKNISGFLISPLNTVSFTNIRILDQETPK